MIHDARWRANSIDITKLANGKINHRLQYIAIVSLAEMYYNMSHLQLYS